MFKFAMNREYKENQIKKQEFVNSICEWGKEAIQYINNKMEIPEFIKNKFIQLVATRAEQLGDNFKEQYKQAILEAIEGVLIVLNLTT